MARKITFTSDDSDSVTASLLCILCSALDETEGATHRNLARVAEEIARQVSREWVSAVRSHVLDGSPDGA